MMKFPDMKTALKTGVISVATLSLFTPQAVAETNSFPDVSEDSYFYEYINGLVDQGVIRGYPDGTFRPLQEVTRAESAAMFKRALDLPKSDLANPFEDIEGSSFEEDIMAVYEAGIFEGTSEERFTPNATLTREQMASVLVRAFDLEEQDDVAVPFEDMDLAMDVHTGDIGILYQNGITRGANAAGTLYDPKGSVPRENFSAFVSRLTTEDEESVDEEEHEEEEHEDEGETEAEAPVITATELVMDNGNAVSGQVNEQGTLTINYDLTSLEGSTRFSSGTLTVDQDSFLTLRLNSSFTIADLPDNEPLHAGQNSLTVAEALGSAGISIDSIMRNWGDEMQLIGTLRNADDQETPVEINFIFR